MAVAPPTFVKVTDWSLLDPTITVPKVTADGLAFKRAVPDETPVPVSAIVKSCPCVSVVILSDPLADPIVEGANVKLAVAVCIGRKVTGPLKPDTLKELPAIPMLEMEMLALPVFEIVRT